MDVFGKVQFGEEKIVTGGFCINVVKSMFINLRSMGSSIGQ